MRRDPRGGRAGAADRDHRQRRADRVHRAEARLGPRPRAGRLAPGGARPAAQGLPAPAADRRARHGQGRRRRARCCSTWPRATGRPRSWRRSRSRAPGCRRRSRARRSPARSPTGPPPRPGCAPGRRSWPAAATRRPTRSASGSSRRGRWRCRSGRRGSCSPRPTGRCSSREGRVHAFCHAVPGRWHLMSVMLSAAGSLRWFRDALAPGVAFADLVGLGRGRARRQRRPVVPALPVRRAQPAPRPAGPGRVRRADPRARSAAHDPGGARGRGLRPARRAGPDDRGRACRHPPRSARRAAASASPLWRQILADVLGAEIATVETTEGAAYGAGAAGGASAPAGTRPSRRPRMPSCASRRSPSPGPTRRPMPSGTPSIASSIRRWRRRSRGCSEARAGGASTPARAAGRQPQRSSICASSFSLTSPGRLPRMIMPSTSSGVDVVLVHGVDDPAVVHDADPVGQVEHVVDVVADRGRSRCPRP